MDNRNNNNPESLESPLDAAVKQPEKWTTGVEEPTSADRAPLAGSAEEQDSRDSERTEGERR